MCMVYILYSVYMSICIYLILHTHLYTYTHIHLSIYIHNTHTSIHIHTHTYIYTYIHIHIYTGLHKESQDLAIQQIQLVLESRDFELASLQQKHSLLVSECMDLRRVSKREGVSMDYLKNIIVKYMSYPISSPERSSLIPVICTILAFNEEECRCVNENVNVWSVPRVAKQVNANR